MKFRLWDTENNCYYTPTYEAMDGKLEYITMGQSGELMMIGLVDGQLCVRHESTFKGRFITEHYLGINDEDGKEMYQGDICVDPHNDISVIRTQPACYSFKGAVIGIDEFEQTNMPLKVIGNVHQNPDSTVRKGYQE